MQRVLEPEAMDTAEEADRFSKEYKSYWEK